MTVAVPFSWLKQLPATALANNDPLPFGSPPPFPWEQFNAIFSKLFQLENVHFEAGNWILRESKELFAGLGSHPFPLHCDVAPLQGTFCWLMAEKDLDQLMSLLLTRKLDGGLIDAEYKHAFCQFLALELFSICNKLDFQKDLTPHLLDSKQLPSAESYCLDVIINIEGKPFFTRIIVTEELRQSWKERFANNKISYDLPKELAEKIKLTAHLECGFTAMKMSTWQHIQPGDFLLLDQSTLNIDQDESQIIITLKRQPLFLAQVKDGNVRIIDYPLYHEATTTMVQNDDEDIDDLDFDIEENHTFSDEMTDITENTTLESEPTTKKPNGHSQAGNPTAKAASVTAKTSEKKPINIHDLAVQVVVEVGQVELSIQKLAELQPGSMLELNVHPEDGVNLTINGQVVAKGELLKIGDSLGVRILEKGV